MTPRTLLIAALPVFLSACAAAPSKPVEVAAVQPSSSPTPVTVLTASSLAGVIRIGGVDCTGFQQIPHPTGGAIERGSCYVGSGEVVLSVFATHLEATQEPVKKAALLGGTIDVTMAVGDNWTASCDEPTTCAQIAGATNASLELLPAGG